MLWGFQGLYATNLARGGNAHTLKPSFNGQPLVEGQPDEGAQFARFRVVRDPCNNLRGGGVVEI